ncbi:MAG TPA: penicillin-binding transpeptidase domain-containing protein [Solirubrobacteraceae bacterium]|nr:penicillin-binding transpeptidase domain-containing protein [Solirubrobacteraceae bacterium]
MLRRRRRSSFSSYGRTGAPWLQPVGRRRRRRFPAGPLLLLGALIVVAAAAAAFFYRRHETADRRQAAAQHFADAWQRGDYAAMYRLITPAARRARSQAAFTGLYRAVRRQATITKVAPQAVGTVRNGRSLVPVRVQTRLFGTLRGKVTLPIEDSGSGSYVAWTPSLRLPGLRPGEAVTRRILRTPARASVLAADGSRLADHPASAAIAGTPPAAGQAGTGLEALYDARLGGRSGAELRFGHRIVRKVPVRKGHSLRSTIVPSVQAAAASALGGRLGGIAVVRPKTGDILALSGLAVSGPQPPGSTFKIITLSAALQHRIATPASSYPVRTYALLSGVRLRNASDESCGGSLTASFAISCNSVFAPLGAKLGAKRLVGAAESFGFNENLKVPAFKPSTIPAPSQLKDDLAVGASAIGQDRDLATPLAMASVGATIGNDGVRARPRIARSANVRKRRVVRASVAHQVRTMMLSVVSSGTGVAAALPGIQVAGKTGTAELRPTASGPPDPSNTDAWFVAFAPAQAPKLAVAVMLVGAGAGGAAAAPLARQVLAAAL